MAIFLAPSFLLFLLVGFLLQGRTALLWAAAQSCGLGELGWGTEGAGQALRSSPGFFFKTSPGNKLAVKPNSVRVSRQAGLGPGPPLGTSGPH